MILYKVIIACHDKYIHGSCVVRILYLKRIKNCLKCGPRDSDIVCVHDVPLVLGEGGGGWSKEIVKCGVGQNNLGSFCGIRGVVSFARGAVVRPRQSKLYIKLLSY